MKAARVNSMADLRESEVCYWKDAETGTWFIYLPGCGAGGLGNHRIVEHEDGTISVTPSILMSGHHGTRGHGYLSHGDWADCPDSNREQGSFGRSTVKMAKKEDLHVGDLVDGLRAFDKGTRVKGKIWQILNGPYIDVQLENGTIEAMHVDDVRVIEAAKPATPPPPATPSPPATPPPDPKVEEAVEYVMHHGYSEEAARAIVVREGVDLILKDRTANQEEKADAAS